MKSGKEHRVPLSAPALAIVAQMKMQRDSEYLFPGGKHGKPLTAERTNFSRRVAEIALAHTIDNTVEAAYRRGDLFQKRIELMDQWAKYCVGNQSAAAQ
jgi:integrase